MRHIFFNIALYTIFKAFIQFYMSQVNYDYYYIICDIYLLMSIIYTALRN